jgi:hypothetical protein
MLADVGSVADQQLDGIPWLTVISSSKLLAIRKHRLSNARCQALASVRVNERSLLMSRVQAYVSLPRAESLSKSYNDVVRSPNAPAMLQMTYISLEFLFLGQWAECRCTSAGIFLLDVHRHVSRVE